MKILNEKVDVNSFLKQVSICFLIVLLTSQTLIVHADPKEWSPPEHIQKKIESALTVFDKFTDMLPASRNTVEKMSDYLDYDFDKAIDYTYRDINYEPYLGVLRGPDGVAATGKGNAWDQALFLAALINTMGGDAQIVLGNLSLKDGYRLLVNSFNLENVSSDLDTNELVKIVENYDQKIAESLELQFQKKKNNIDLLKLNKDTEDITGDLISLLKSENFIITDQLSMESYIQRVSNDYAWVRWREKTGDDWKDLHPAFNSSTSPNIKPTNFISSKVPKNFLHQVALQLVIERRTSRGEFEQVAIMDRYIRPTSQLFKKQISISLVPLDADENGQASFLVPILNGAIAPGGKAITALGLTAEAGDISNSYAKFFATLSSKMGGALGALNNTADNNKNEGPRLSGVLLIVEIISPNGKTQRIKRRLVDLRNNTPFELSAASFTSLLDIGIGAENSSDVARRAIKSEVSFLKSLPSILAVSRGNLTLNELKKSKYYSKMPDPVWPDIDLLSNTFMKVNQKYQKSFRPGPMVVARHSYTDPKKGLVTSTDIISNSVMALRNENNKITMNISDSISQGVRDTLVESILARNKEGWSQRLPTFLISKKITLTDKTVISNWPKTALSIAEKDIESGYVLALMNETDPHWWRINPKTGETLGMGLYGGVETADYTVTLILITAAVSTFFFRESVKSCGETFPNNRQMNDCCVVGNLALTYTTAVGTGAGGGFIKGLFSTAAGSLIASVGIDSAEYLVAGGPINSACSAYLNR